MNPMASNPLPRRAARHLVTAVLVAGAAAWSGGAVNSQSNIVCEENRCQLSGRITADMTLTADNVYLLNGAVFVEAPARLTIEAGTTIYGQSETNGTLVISRGAQILANGTANAPIVMTSDQLVGERARGDWGGLIINGNAPLNVPGGEAEGADYGGPEGDTA